MLYAHILAFYANIVDQCVIIFSLSNGAKANYRLLYIYVGKIALKLYWYKG